MTILTRAPNDGTSTRCGTSAHQGGDRPSVGAATGPSAIEYNDGCSLQTVAHPMTVLASRQRFGAADGLPARPAQRVEDRHVSGCGYHEPCGSESSPPNWATRCQEIADNQQVQSNPSGHPRAARSPSHQSQDQGEVGKADDACAAWIREADESSESCW